MRILWLIFSAWLRVSPLQPGIEGLGGISAVSLGLWQGIAIQADFLFDHGKVKGD